MDWELIEVGPMEMECTIDKSGVYTIVNRVVRTETHKEYAGMRVLVRVDIMGTVDDSPMISFIGGAENVRKHVMAWLDTHILGVTVEHASYIGAEIHRASVEANYVQD